MYSSRTMVDRVTSREASSAANRARATASEHDDVPSEQDIDRAHERAKRYQALGAELLNGKRRVSATMAPTQMDDRGAVALHQQVLLLTRASEDFARLLADHAAAQAAQMQQQRAEPRAEPHHRGRRHEWDGMLHMSPATALLFATLSAVWGASSLILGLGLAAHLWLVPPDTERRPVEAVEARP